MVLQSIRERLTGVLAFAILGILVIPFALVGVTQYFTAADSNIVARVNETDITTNEFNQSFSNYRRQMQSIMGAAYDPVQFDQLTVRREHLDNLINQELLVQAADSLGLDVDDETLAEEIRNIPAFQVDGQFNADVYQSRLQSQGMTNVLVRQTGCMGLCYSEPTVEVLVPEMPGVVYGNVDAEIGRRIVTEHIKEHKMVEGFICDKPAADIIS